MIGLSQGKRGLTNEGQEIGFTRFTMKVHRANEEWDEMRTFLISGEVPHFHAKEV